MNINEAKKRLKASEEKYRRLFEAARDGILILDAVSGKIQDVNPYFLEITGYSAEEITGSAPWQLPVFGDIIETKKRFEEIKKNGYVRYDDLPLHTKSGAEVPVEFVSNVYKAGENRVIQCNVRVIKKRKELEEKNRLYSQSVDEAALEIFWINPEGKFDYVNNQACRRLGYSSDELVNMSVWDVDPNFSEEDWRDKWKKLKEEKVQDLESEHSTADGQTYPVEITSHYIKYNGDEYEFAFARDITDRKQSQRKLEEERNMFILGPTVVFRWIADEKKGWPVTYVSPNVEDLLAYSPAEFVGDEISYRDIVHEDDLSRIRKELKEAEKSGEKQIVHEPYRLCTGEGKIKWVRDYTIFKWEEGQVVGYQGYVVDITSLKEREEELVRMNEKLEETERKLRQSLAEQEVLHQEIHHRVKNNLQQIMGILALQEERIKDKQARQALQRSQERVRAMGLIHGLLYRSDDISEVSIAEYTEELVGRIEQTYNGEADIDIELDLDNSLLFNVDCALACGLLINELISNAYEHGLAGGTKNGKIELKIKPTPEERIIISVADSGTGFAPEVDFENPTSLGLQLVRGIATRELQGKISLHQNGMTRIKIEFPTPCRGRLEV